MRIISREYRETSRNLLLHAIGTASEKCSIMKRDNPQNAGKLGWHTQKSNFLLYHPQQSDELNIMENIAK